MTLSVEKEFNTGRQGPESRVSESQEPLGIFSVASAGLLSAAGMPQSSSTCPWSGWVPTLTGQGLRWTLRGAAHHSVWGQDGSFSVKTKHCNTVPSPLCLEATALQRQQAGSWLPCTQCGFLLFSSFPVKTSDPGTIPESAPLAPMDHPAVTRAESAAFRAEL